MSTPTDFTIGQRIKMHPATDRWMMGDRYGEITRVGRKWLSVKFDCSGQTRFVAPDNIQEIVEPTLPRIDQR